MPRLSGYRQMQAHDRLMRSTVRTIMEQGLGRNRMRVISDVQRHLDPGAGLIAVNVAIVEINLSGSAKPIGYAYRTHLNLWQPTGNESTSLGRAAGDYLPTQVTSTPINQITPEVIETNIHAFMRMRWVFSMLGGQCEIHTADKRGCYNAHNAIQHGD